MDAYVTTAQLGFERPWVSSTAKTRPRTRTRATLRIGRRKAAGNAQQVRFFLFLCPFFQLNPFTRYSLQAAEPQSLAAHIDPQDRPPDSFHNRHNLRPHWWPSHLGLVPRNRDYLRLHELRKPHPVPR